jgi:protocatechuate 3,4-dioxygenase beta subunit
VTESTEPTSTEQGRREQQVTDEVVASFAGADSQRYRELMTALVRHAHAFAREVRLTEAEWMQGIEFLTRCGQITTDRRQEFILLSDVLGLSMLTVGINNPPDGDATEATVFGPFFVEGSPQIPIGGDLAQGVAGQPCWVSGTVRGSDGIAIAGALIEVWEADDDGFYDVQYGDEHTAGRGHLFSSDDGSYGFWAVTPTPYPIPDDGPVGDLLKAAGRGPMRAPHLHFMVIAPGYRRLITHIFVRGNEYLDRDAVFGVKSSLIKDFVEHPPGTATPNGRSVESSWTSAHFDIALAPSEPVESAEEQQ